MATVCRHFLYYVLFAVVFCVYSSPSFAFSRDTLNGRWRINTERTEEIQPSSDTQIMEYKAVFAQMYIDINLSNMTISYGIDGAEPDIVNIEDIKEDKGIFTLYIEHDPVQLTFQGNGLLRYTEEGSRVYLILIKQLPI